MKKRMKRIAQTKFKNSNIQMRWLGYICTSHLTRWTRKWKAQDLLWHQFHQREVLILARKPGRNPWWCRLTPARKFALQACNNRRFENIVDSRRRNEVVLHFWKCAEKHFLSLLQNTTQIRVSTQLHLRANSWCCPYQTKWCIELNCWKCERTQIVQEHKMCWRWTLKYK